MKFILLMAEYAMPALTDHEGLKQAMKYGHEKEYEESCTLQHLKKVWQFIEAIFSR